MASSSRPRPMACEQTELVINTLEVHPIHSFDTKFPFFKQPEEIGCFSQDSKRNFVDDGSQLKFYCPPKQNTVSYDLRIGYRSWVEKDANVQKFIDDLLRWILNHRDVFKLSDAKRNDRVFNLFTDFVTWRGLYTKILCTPFENRDGWTIAVTKYKGTHYMCEFDTEEQIAQRANQTDREREMTYWGLKFEQYVMAFPDKEPVMDVPVNSNEEFSTVMRSRLNKHSLVYGAEIDGYELIDGEKKYVELKTSREIDHDRQLSNFKRYKLKKWWAQSFLVGIDKIVCGFRDDSGVVHRLHNYETHALPSYCKNTPNSWLPNVCFNFLDSFLQFVKDSIKEDHPRVVYTFSWSPRKPVECIRRGLYSEYSFLPKWYVEATSKRS